MKIKKKLDNPYKEFLLLNTNSALNHILNKGKALNEKIESDTISKEELTEYF